MILFIIKILTLTLASTSNMLIGKTLGLVEVFSGFAFLAIMFRNRGTKLGLGYSSMSDGRTKWVKAESLAMFRATFTGYKRLLFFMYVVEALTHA